MGVEQCVQALQCSSYVIGVERRATTIREEFEAEMAEKWDNPQAGGWH
jgi:hypothetical protein